MKTLIFSVLVALIATFLALKVFALDGVPENSPTPAEFSSQIYSNDKFGYEINRPDSFVMNSDISELVTFEKNSSKLRINAGCLDFGTEELAISQQAISINGKDALKESYYSEGRLVMERYFLNQENSCYSLELMAKSTEDWQELQQMAGTFRFTR